MKGLGRGSDAVLAPSTSRSNGVAANAGFGAGAEAALGQWGVCVSIQCRYILEGTQ